MGKINMIKLITNNFLLKRYKSIYIFSDKKNKFKLKK